MQLDFLRRFFAPPELPAPLPPPVPKPQPRTISALPLQQRAQELLHALGYPALADRLTVCWNQRMRSTAGLAYPAAAKVTLNPRLVEFGPAEIDRTLLHEVAHLLAHERAGRRRITPHGPEWRKACADLGLHEETRCHTLPLPRRQIARKYRYRCPICGFLLNRVRPLRGKSACLACCRRHNGGRFDERFTLVRVKG